MEDPEQAAAYSAADFAEAHQRLVDAFVARFPELADDPELAVLDLGCGPADVTVRLARALPSATLLGVDGSPAMLAPGIERVRVAGLAHRVHLEHALLPDASLEQRRFGAIVSTSVLHHLGDPAVLWRTIAACAAPDAAIFVADLVRPRDDAAVDAIVAAGASGEPPVLVEDFRNSLRAAYRPDEVRTQAEAAGLDLVVETIGDRHLAAWGRRN
jgi:cyclopropane fatty-acyl-phospholipid synthase-like methyltransferase